MREEKNWSYKNFQIREGLKPGSNHFQYFFVVSEGGEKKVITAYGLRMRPYPSLHLLENLMRSCLQEERIGVNGFRERLTGEILEIEC